MKRWVGLSLIVLAVACSATDRKADRLLLGGIVHTEAGVRRAAVAIGGGRVLALVEAEDVEGWVGPETEVVELDGGHVLPGLIDSHLHLTGFGTSLEQVDCSGAGSWAEVVLRAVRGARGLPPGAWVEGRGWDQNLWTEKAFPDRAELDRKIDEHPVLLRRVDGHAAVANARALALAGIARDTPDPPGGRILRRPDGEPSGVLLDTAVGLVRDVVPPAGPDDIERRILRACDYLVEVGLTHIHEPGTAAAELAVLRRLAAAGRLPVRVYVFLDGDDPELLDRELARGPDLEPGAMLRVGGVKLYADGALGSRGALLGDDYHDDPGNRGLAVTSPERLRSVAGRASRAGFQVAIHAIGDEAVHRVLGVYDSLGAETSSRLRHRVEHSQTVRPADVQRFARLGLVASVQPTHCTSDMPWAPDRLGPERIGWAYRWRSLAAAGARLAGGSDAPVEDPDPRRGLHAAVTRQQPGGMPPGGWNPAERVDREQAIELFTTGGALAAHAESWCGAVAPGFVADLTVVGCDPIGCDPERLLHMNVLRTIVGGEDRYVVDDGAAAGGAA